MTCANGFFDCLSSIDKESSHSSFFARSRLFCLSFQKARRVLCHLDAMWRIKVDLRSLFQTQLLAPIDGLRAISCLCITALHMGFVLNVLLPSYPHLQWMLYLQSYSYRLMAFLVLWLETFFMLSGFLLTQKLIQQRFVLSLREYLRYVLKRACRLWPGVLLATVVSLTLGEPKTNWLSIWLFYQNCIDMEKWATNVAALWTVSLDMQMHVLLPLVLAAIAYCRGTSQKICLALYLLMALSVAYSFLVFDPVTMDALGLAYYKHSMEIMMPARMYDWITTTYNMTLPFERPLVIGSAAPFMDRLYFPTISRYSSFVVGSILALYLYDASQATASRSGTLKKYAYLTVITLFMLLLTSPPKPGTVHPLVLSIMISIIRQLFAIAQAFILFCTLCPPTHPYYSAWLKWFLTMRIWTPIARLSYLIYVLHSRVVLEMIMTHTEFFDPSLSSFDRLVFICLVLVLIICVIISIPWFVLVEKPFERLVNRLLRNQRKSHVA